MAATLKLDDLYNESSLTANVTLNADGSTTIPELNSPQVTATNGIFYNNTTVSTSVVLPAGVNASSVGPMTLASGVSVTVPSGGRWVIS